MNRAERKAANRAAHAIRRRLIEAEWADAKSAGLALAWRDIADQYAALPTDVVLATFGETDPAPVVAPEPVTPRAKRVAPAHVREAQESFAMARAAWELGLEAAVAGGHTKAAGGRPANGESYPDEERDYRAANPAPVFKDFLADVCARMRADRAMVTA